MARDCCILRHSVNPPQHAGASPGIQPGLAVPGTAAAARGKNRTWNSPAACEIWLVSEKTRKEKEEENSLNQSTEKPFLRTSLQGKASLLQASAGVLDYRAQVGLMQVAGVQPGAPGSFRGCV